MILVASKRRVVSKFRDTLGLKGRFSSRLQPNDPSDDLKAIASGILDGLLYGGGDAAIGINPATDSVPAMTEILKLIDELVYRYAITAIERGAPVDLVFQSIAGTEIANKNFGINLSIIREAHEAALSLRRGTVGDNVMYFETGQGSALSAEGNWDVDMQTCEARAYAVARESRPLLVNTVVGLKTIFAASFSDSPWVATSATPTTPRRIRTTWTPSLRSSPPQV